MLQRLANPYLLLTLAALFWSSNMVIGRAIRGDIPPFTLAFGRWVVAGLIVLPLALPQVKALKETPGRPKFPCPPRGAGWAEPGPGGAQWPQLKAGWRPLLILGLLGIAGYNTFAYLGLQHTTATNAALLNAFVPIATIAISWAFLGKRLKPLEAAGVLISLGGALTIVARGELQVLARLDLNIGDLWMLLAVLDWALYTIALAWRPAGLHSMLMLGATIGIGIAAMPLGVAIGSPLWGVLYDMTGGYTVQLIGSIVAALLACAAPARAQLPLNAQLVNGSAVINQFSNGLQIINSPGAILNWDSFSIGANRTVRFDQQTALSAVLNRDIPVMQCFTLLLTTLLVLCNLVVDICYAWLDPRTRLAGVMA